MKKNNWDKQNRETENLGFGKKQINQIKNNLRHARLWDFLDFVFFCFKQFIII